ncbi:hypothetical protein Syun_008628 [Stephania yunnanensis]|uniref:Apoptosis inhibitor 5 n=1 Tax=Stephania yunnanensis TaxID=152371 RepID=A0AAP0KEY9_9MAGN
MAEVVEDTGEIEKLYEYGERLNEAKDKSQLVKEYEGIIRAAKGSTKAKQLAAQLIPRFFKFFPTLRKQAIEAHYDLCEEEDELAVRVQAIRGLPLFCKDTPENVSEIVVTLGQLLTLGRNKRENVERDAVHKGLMSLLRQDAKASLTALFKLIESTDEPNIEEAAREKVLAYIRDKLKYFGEGAPPERVRELIELIEGQADLDTQFNVSDGDHIDRLISCLCMALPFYKLPEERKLDLLKNLAESSPYTSPPDARHILPSIVQLLKTPNATNSLCGYKIVTGQPSDRLGEDFSECYKEFTERCLGRNGGAYPSVPIANSSLFWAPGRWVGCRGTGSESYAYILLCDAILDHLEAEFDYACET